MTGFGRLLRANAARVAAAACCAGAFAVAVPPQVSAAQVDAAAAPFHFTAYPLNTPDRPGERTLRPVAPVYKHINAWISSVGAAAALFAVDGGVVSHDVCLVDPRTDTVTVEPAPTTGQRYRPFTLSPTGLYQPSYAAPMGCVPADLTGSGWQDLIVYYWGRSPVIFMRKPGVAPGPGAFVARELVPGHPIWNTNAMTYGDYDGTGHLDLVVGNYFPDGGRLLDPTAVQPQLQMPSSFSNAKNGGTLRMFRFVSASGGASPDVHYAEVPDAFGPTPPISWTLALGTQDLADNGLPDIFQANDFGPNRLLVNQSTPGHIAFRTAIGLRHFTTPKSKVLGIGSFKGMGVAFADLDRSGRESILVSSITEPYGLQESNLVFQPTASGARFAADLDRGFAPYDEHGDELGLAHSGWTWDVVAADFDNSGYPQVLHATGFVAGHTDRWAQLQEAATSNDLILRHPELWPNIEPGDEVSGHDSDTFFVRTPSGRYVDIAQKIGVAPTAITRGLAVGDVDGDGRLDYVAANQWGQSFLFHNESQAGPYVGLRLRLPAQAGGSGVGAPAIGAVATLDLPGGGVTRQQLYPANGHGGVAAPELHFGLGGERITGPLRIRIEWRDPHGVRHTAVPALSPGLHTLVLADDGTTAEVPA